MANAFFKFKQFEVWHDKCAMKVGTDGVLLGAWADVSNARRILDVGTGTGLVSLMLAQRCEAQITALEIDEKAVYQAKENVLRSWWKHRIQVEQRDFKTYRSEVKFDLIVSNPPYFVETKLCVDGQRALARHTGELTYEELVMGVTENLAPLGLFTLIIPMDVACRVTELAGEHHLFPIKQLRVLTKPGLPAKRTMLSFSFQQQTCVTDELVIELERHQYSPEYIELTKAYYLKM